MPTGHLPSARRRHLARPHLCLHLRAGPARLPWFTGREKEDLILYRPRFKDGDASRLPPDVEASFGMAPGVFAAYPEAKAFSVMTPGGGTYAIDAPELKAEPTRAGTSLARRRGRQSQSSSCHPSTTFFVSCISPPTRSHPPGTPQRRAHAPNWIVSRPQRRDGHVADGGVRAAQTTCPCCELIVPSTRRVLYQILGF